MSRGERARLEDIKRAIIAIDDYLFDSPASDVARLHDALLFQLIVIGEAVKHLDPSTKAAARDIPWSDVAALRDLITHESIRIDMDLIRATAERDLPPLLAAVERLLLDEAP